MAEPTCCDEPMVHNSFTSEYECASAYFGLHDDGVLVDGLITVGGTENMTDEQRKRFEHWKTTRVPDGWSQL